MPHGRLIGAGIAEGKLIDGDPGETARLPLNFGEGAQKRTRLHTERADRLRGGDPGRRAGCHPRRGRSGEINSGDRRRAQTAAAGQNENTVELSKVGDELELSAGSTRAGVRHRPNGLFRARVDHHRP